MQQGVGRLSLSRWNPDELLNESLSKVCVCNNRRRRGEKQKLGPGEERRGKRIMYSGVSLDMKGRRRREGRESETEARRDWEAEGWRYDEVLRGMQLQIAGIRGKARKAEVVVSGMLGRAVQPGDRTVAVHLRRATASELETWECLL